MRPVFLNLFFIALFSISCEKASHDFGIPEGIYVGTFQRSTSNGGQISNVTITFSANTWTGQSQYAKYPALCGGTYKVTALNNVTFENTCAWTAEFDGSLILSQDYEMKITGHNLELSRGHNGLYKDIYKLTKQ